MGGGTADVIKIDVEGAEGLVIQGMNKIFAQKKFPVNIIELHGPECKETVIAHLNNYNYTFYNLDLIKLEVSQIKPRHQFIAMQNII